MSATPERIRAGFDPKGRWWSESKDEGDFYESAEYVRADIHAELEQAVDEIDAAQTILEAGGSYAAFHVAVRDAVLRARQGVQHE
jgi:hypothetical protein